MIADATIRVDHRPGPEDYIAAGHDVEASVLARAVQWHVEHRILLNGVTTIVFR
jgi:formyltetrahydrofolate deformylase